jgi:tetratricopeptide (TPR) repeat protein
MRSFVALLVFVILVSPIPALAQDQEGGPADDLWELYKEGRFEEVITLGKALLATENETAQVNLAVGRSLVDLEKIEDAFPYLTRAVDLDPNRTWVYAWAQLYLGNTHLESGDDDRARQAWMAARDCGATRNATRNAGNNLKYFGLSEFFADWKPFGTEHFSFRFSGRLKDFDRVEFARRYENAYAEITQWFGGGPDKTIRFLLWSSQDEADEAGMPALGFSRPAQHLIHAVQGQTVGHEMTHIISFHALKPTVRTGLINEGISVHMDLTGRDQMERARALKASANPEPLKVSIPAMWLDWSLAPEAFSYPVAGAFVGMLIEKGGKDKFLEFFQDQSYENAQKVYGGDLAGWIKNFEDELYR